VEYRVGILLAGIWACISPKIDYIRYSRTPNIAMLKPQDNLVLLWHLAYPQALGWTYASLAAQLGMSASETHAATKRLMAARLMHYHPLNQGPGAFVSDALAYLINGLPHVFPAEIGADGRGVPTGLGCPLLESDLAAADREWVWPAPDGTARGPAIKPLYRSVPGIAKRDDRMYALLALVDLLRVGRVRERLYAEAELERRLTHVYEQIG
jgi:hypothetical protein